MLEKKVLFIYLFNFIFILCCLHFLVNFVIKEKDLFVGNNWIFDNWFMKISILKTKWFFFPQNFLTLFNYHEDEDFF
jgi:hypothetical protein